MSGHQTIAMVLTLLLLVVAPLRAQEINVSGQENLGPLSSLRLGPILIEGLASAPTIISVTTLPNAFETVSLQSHTPVDIESIRSELAIYRNLYLLVQGSVMVAFILAELSEQ